MKKLGISFRPSASVGYYHSYSEYQLSVFRTRTLSLEDEGEYTQSRTQNVAQIFLNTRICTMHTLVDMG